MNHTRTHRFSQFLTLCIVTSALAGPQAPGLAPPGTTTTGSALESLRIDPDWMAPRNGHAFFVTLNSIDQSEADSSGNDHHSQWVLLEDDRPLPLGHAVHAEIESLGMGRYSHWGGQLIFSSSDNSDPRTNGRRYTLVDTMSDDGSRVAFAGLCKPLVIHVGDSLWLGDTTTLSFFQPANGPLRSVVNPEMPAAHDHTIQFSKAGEYYLMTTTGPIRTLVLDKDATNWPESISLFVSSNLAPGQEDEPDWKSGDVKWEDVDRSLMCKLFHGDKAISVRCGLAARMTSILAESVGLTTRYISWLDTKTTTGGHIGIEVFNPVIDQWEYVDPNFGLRVGSGTSALDFWQSLRGPNWADELKSVTTPAGRWLYEANLEYNTLYQTYAQVHHVIVWWDNIGQTSGTALVGPIGAGLRARFDGVKSLHVLDGDAGIEYVRERLYQSSNPWPSEQAPSKADH